MLDLFKNYTYENRHEFYLELFKRIDGLNMYKTYAYNYDSS